MSALERVVPKADLTTCTSPRLLLVPDSDAAPFLRAQARDHPPAGSDDGDEIIPSLLCSTQDLFVGSLFYQRSCLINLEYVS